MEPNPRLDWSKLFTQRQAVAKTFGSIWSLPVARRYYNVLAELGKPQSILELGAGDRGLAERMKSFWGSFDYRSCDIDDTGDHDFSHIDDVQGRYDLICALEMIEHVTLEDAHHILLRCHALLHSGATIALTTPNVFYPPAFLRDATHVTPFCYDELGGLLQLCGFEVTRICRLHHDSVLKKFAKRYLFYPFFRLLGVDFAHQIMVVARKR
jgi:hypothetical protein